MKILGVVSSPRFSRVPDGRLEKFFKDGDVFNAVHEIGYEGKVSNSQALLLAALWSAKNEGADVDIMYPGDTIPDFDGVVMSSPVYFGDRSSHLHDFIRNVDMKDKSVGIVSSGAKRNGGQETTNIYALYDCLDKGALITGNGPPTAQYGGTGWAGNKTAIVNDDFGITTSVGTGRQVTKLAQLINSPECTKKPTILLMVVTTDPIDISFSDKFKDCNVKVIDITKEDIKRCIACPVCPNGDLEAEYTCIIPNDGMSRIHDDMMSADGVIFVSGTDDTKFQIFIERTRFIRRNHFEWEERVYSSFSETKSITDILPIRVMTNMLRQNMFGLQFFRECRGFTNIDIDLYVKMIEKYTRKSMTLRESSNVDSRYTAVGYEDAKINEKAYRD